jgi:mRNA-degrading endonuclease YafQ of YafQ-DinJ toxin-antitoxin module
MEWQVIESQLTARQLKRAPRDIQEKYAIWRARVETSGPHLRGGYRVHALQGNRKGEKAARLSRQWRVIFKVFEQQLVVEALELTPHKY